MAESGPVSRRRFLALGGLGVGAGLLLPRTSLPAVAAQPEGVPIGAGHTILRRDVWGAGLPPVGEMAPETPEDVLFLLVHHSASPNDYQADQSVQFLRSFYRYHTSSEKGWPDIAYNFLVDRYGRIFEGREGSIESPVRGDATGGSQGFALLACFIGDHREVAPTLEAQSAMVALLAWLAGTYGIETRPDSTVEFISRGSNLHPEGKTVVTPTITGHRTMSRTTCPGDQAFKLVEETFPREVTAARSTIGSASATTGPTSTVPATPPPTTAPTPLTSEGVETTQGAVEPPSDAGDIAALPATAPATPTTTERYETSIPASSAVSSGAAPDIAVAPAPSVSGNSEAPSNRSKRVLEMMWTGLAATVLGAVLWLRRRADPAITPVNEQWSVAEKRPRRDRGRGR
ncbi:MAG: N-acetylmuramoyl-L-alanine amidase [bacterium]|nr:N-acetylmuramoyl-L-alanine amidase [bacterium]